MSNLLFYSLLAFIYTIEAEDIDLVIGKDQSVPIENPHPADYRGGTDVKWNLVAEDLNAKIRLSCEYFSLFEDSPCIDFMSINDGNSVQTLCGSQYDLSIISEGPKMTVHLYINPDHYGTLDCEANLLYPSVPELVTLHLRDPIYFLHSPEMVPRFFDQRWIFRTDPGLRVALTCSDFRYSPANPCDAGMEVNDGVNTQVYCGSQQGMKVFSVDQELLVKLFSGIHAGGAAKCIVQAVNGASSHQYKNEVSAEIDSSEHGTKAGMKKTSCDCGWTNKPNGRILHGTETGINEYPWMVAIRESLQPGDEVPAFHFCGGSIITRYHVLSAAHCVHYRMDQELYAVVGEHNIRTENETNATQHIKIARKIVFNDYRFSDQHHDIVVLVLENPIEFNQRVGPVCLSTQRLNLAYKYVLVTGWGITQLGRPSDALMKTYLRVLDYNECVDLWGYLFSAKEEEAHKVCTDSRKKATCMGDSGGPLVTLDHDTNRYTQVSLVSFGAGCGTSGRPSVSVEVAPFYNWISQVIKDTYPDEMICIKQD